MKGEIIIQKVQEIIFPSCESPHYPLVYYFFLFMWVVTTILLLIRIYMDNSKKRQNRGVYGLNSAITDKTSKEISNE